MRKLAEDYQVKPDYIPHAEAEDAFGRISKILESRYDFSESTVSLSETDRSQLQIWATMNQKEELEYVAKSIRQRFMMVCAIRIFVCFWEMWKLPASAQDHF